MQLGATSATVFSPGLDGHFGMAWTEGQVVEQWTYSREDSSSLSVEEELLEVRKRLEDGLHGQWQQVEICFSNRRLAQNLAKREYFDNALCIVAADIFELCNNFRTVHFAYL
ncbi:acetyl-CoA C-acetyltransferase family protein [Striga asiatica]|uniref:Acetyl-CoA C-acetyltransferase family protein n=1 Tax=Striga asiatica TaxID=4170 RepID=A0A5A7PXR3_STRAF|nr:acetyl-CoA C-acetyltransferase family protein [Striga asiatica]